jgi:hypothetical protein
LFDKEALTGFGASGSIKSFDFSSSFNEEFELLLLLPDESSSSSSK